VKYDLSVSLRVSDSELSSAYCPPAQGARASLAPINTEPCAPGLHWSGFFRSTAYVIRSVKPFWFYRWPARKPLYQFTTRLTGWLAHTGYRVAGDPELGVRWAWDEWVDPLVTGMATVSDPSPAAITFEAAPRFTCKEVRAHWSTGEVTNHCGIYFATSGKTQEIDWGRRFGHAFSFKFTGPWKPAPTWTFRFTPVARADEPEPERERWQVDVRGTDQWRWGVLTGLRAGVNVDWLHRTILQVEDGVIVSARGKVSIQNVWPYSEPPGVFTVTPTKQQTRPEYTLPSAAKAKRSNRVTLNTYDRRWASSSEYLLRYAIRLTGPQAAEIIRHAGLPQPDELYARLVKRGPVIDSVSPHVPDPARIVFLLKEGFQRRPTQASDERVKCPPALTDQSCFRGRGDQTVTVTRLR